MIGSLTLCATAQAALDQLKFTLPWLPVGDYAYYTAGIELGFYRDEGIELKVNRGFGSIDTATKLAAGAFDVGELDIAAIITGRLNKNLPVRCIASNQTISPGGFLVLKSSGIKTLANLEGHTIGTQPGNAMLLYLPLLARQNGFDMGKIKISNVDSAAMAGLLFRKKIDAAAFLVTNQQFLDHEAARFGEQVRALRYADYGLEIYGQCIAASEQSIATKTDVLKRFLRATLRARRYALANPEQTVAIHTKAYPEIDATDALFSLKAVLPYLFNKVTDQSGLGNFDMQRVKNTYEIVVAAQGLPTTGNFRDVIDSSLLPAGP